MTSFNPTASIGTAQNNSGSQLPASIRQTGLWFCFLILLCPALASAADSNPADWTWNDPRDLGIEGLSHHSFHSKSMNRTVGYQIYLPPHYFQEPERRFPVVYFLHGAGGTESSDAGLAARVDAEIRGHRIAPVIYVFPNGGARSGYRDSTSSYVRVRPC